MNLIKLKQINYTKGVEIGQQIESFKCFSKSLVNDWVNEYWRLKVVGAMDNSQVFYIASHRINFARNMAKVVKKIISLNKKQGKNFVIRECACGNGIFGLHFLKQLQEVLKNSKIPFSEIKYELIDYQSVIDEIKKKKVFEKYKKNIIYTPLNLLKSREKPRKVDLILINYLFGCFPAVIFEIKKGKLFRKEVRILYIGNKKLDKAGIEKIRINLKKGDYDKIPKEIGIDLVAEVKNVPCSLSEFSGDTRKYLEKELKLKETKELIVHEKSVKEILNPQFADLKSSGYLINSDFGPTNKTSFQTYSFVANVFRNSAYPHNFRYFKFKYPNSLLVTDKKIASWLVAKDKKSLEKIAKVFKTNIGGGHVSKVNDLLGKVKLLVQAKNKKAADQVLKKAVQFDPDDDQVWLEAAYCYLSLKDYKQAIKAAKKVLRLREKIQDLASAYFILSKSYRLLKDFKKAMFYLDKATNGGAKSPDVYMEKGCLEFAGNRFSQAVSAFEESFKLAPNWSALVNKFDCLRRQGQAGRGMDQLLISMVKEIDEQFLANPGLKKEVLEMEAQMLKDEIDRTSGDLFARRSVSTMV